MLEKQRLLNTYVNNVTLDETLDEIDELIHKRKKSYIVAINVDVVMKMESDDYLRRITNEADMVLVDGKPLIWISKLYKRQIKEKVSGSDLVPQMCKRAADENYTIFIIGGKDGVAEQAKKKLEQKFPGIRIVGTYAPPLGFENDESELDKINQMITDAHPDLLIGCLGCPKQEKWIAKYRSQMFNIKLFMALGATIDFEAGNIKRAPILFQKMAMEWFYRFLREPKRLFRRYFIDDVCFFYYFAKQLLGRYKDPFA